METNTRNKHILISALLIALSITGTAYVVNHIRDYQDLQAENTRLMDKYLSSVDALEACEAHNGLLSDKVEESKR